MRALLLDRLPNVAIANKEDHTRALNGVKVNDAAMIQALLKYGTYDAYYYIREAADNSKEEAYEHRERLHSFDLGSLESLRDHAPDELVLFTSSHHLAKFVPFRQFCNHTEWPICGITHGLSANTLIPAYAWNHFSATKTYDAIICTSQAGRNSLHRIFDGLAKSQSVTGLRELYAPWTTCIPLGIEPSAAGHRRALNAEAGFVVVSLGRFSPSHKADLRPFIAAFLTATQLPKNSTLILAGDDAQYRMAGSLQEFARSFTSANRVTVLPDVPASMKQALLNTADVALCLSDTYQETFGLSVLEAMAAGLPVVAANWDGYRDLVVHEDTGFLIGSYVCEDTGYLNAVSMLIDPAFPLCQRVMIDTRGVLDALALLGSHREMACEMGMRGRKRALSCFSWKAIVPQYEELWDKLLARSRKFHRSGRTAQFGYLDYLEVFQDHPQETLPLDARVSLSKVDRAQVPSVAWFTPAPVAGFSSELDERILERCAMSEVQTIRELVESLSSVSSGPSMVITQVSRLIKYGLLHASVGEPQLLQSQEQDHEQLADSSLRPVGV